MIDPEDELAAVEEEGPALGTMGDPLADIDPLTGKPRKPEPADA